MVCPSSSKSWNLEREFEETRVSRVTRALKGPLYSGFRILESVKAEQDSGQLAPWGV